MALTHSPSLTTDSLVLCLDAGNPRSYSGTGTTWFDVAGNNYNATLTDGTSFNQSSFVFDGINDGVNLNRSFFLTPDAFSVIIWFKPGLTKSGPQMLIYEGQGDGFGSNDEFHLHFDTITPGAAGSINVWMTPSINTGSSLGTVPTNIYSQVCYTVTGLNSTASGKLYLNDTLVVSPSGAITRADYGVNTLVGRPQNLNFPTPPGRSFEGDIAQVYIYNKELSATEVQQCFNAMRGRFGV